MPTPSSPFRRAAGAGALALALVAVSVAPATAADGRTGSSSSVGEVAFDAVSGSLEQVPVGSTAALLGSVGSSDVPIVPMSVEEVGVPSEVDPTITETEFLGISRYDGPGDVYEYWSVQSAAMQRVVTVEVVRSRGEGAAPVMYMLDGVGAPEYSTGWNHVADIHEVMADENVHIVNPAGAFASFYSDWEKEDPVLGNHKWETFLTEELPAIVAEELDTNGRSAIAGNSMGAQAAMHLAAQHPDIYDAVIALSGNYSTLDPLGYQTVRLSVVTRGGDLDNMWGPRGSERWRYHDTISHPEKLRGTAVYMSAGNGDIGPEDPGEYGSEKHAMWFGIVLERGVNEATRKFSRALTDAGVTHRADYGTTGLHNWATFMRHFDDGWEYIKPALQN
ncbi:MAG: alpha/beta hydrolase [Dietzia sp.]